MLFTGEIYSTVRNLITGLSKIDTERLIRKDLSDGQDFTVLTPFYGAIKTIAEKLSAIDLNAFPDNIVSNLKGPLESLSNILNYIQSLSIANNQGSVPAMRQSYIGQITSSTRELIQQAMLIMPAVLIFDASFKAATESGMKFSDQLLEARGQLDQLKSSIAKEVKDVLDQEKKTIVEAMHFTENYVKMRSSKEYWNDIKNSNRITSIVFFGLVALFITAFVFWIRPGIIDDMPKDKWTLDIYIRLSIAAIALIWPLRILLKLAFGFLHTSLDAGEKVVMISTYTAMSSDDKMIKSDTERAIILTAIFRPCQTGMIKDEQLPSLPMDLLRKAMKD